MKKRFFLRVAACVLLVLLCFLVSCGDKEVPKTPDELEAQSLEELLFYLKEVAYFPLPDNFDHTGLDRADIVAATGDRYAQYFTEEEYAAYTADLGGNLVGIGVSITQYEQENLLGIHVLATFQDAPATLAGMRAGDVIVGVDGVAVSDIGYQAALAAIAGEAGTTVTLACLRGTTPYTVTVTRNNCTKQTVHSRILSVGGTRIGYVYITEFDAVTTYQFVNAIEALETAGVDKILFDLRGNPGGYLHTVCEMLAFALPDGDICSVDYGYESYEDYTVRSENGALVGIGNATMQNGAPLPISHSLTGIPLGVLIDGGTASAAELFTSALRDYAADGLLDVTIFGTKSYGKGSMQSSVRLSNGDHVKMTLALYNPPSGVNYNGVGILPSEGCTVSTPYETVVPRFLGDYGDIGTQDAALTFALDFLA